MIYSIDRFEGDIAVCEDENKRFIHLEKYKLTWDAHEGDCFRLDDGGTMEFLPDETAQRRERAAQWQRKLLQRKKPSSALQPRRRDQ